MTDFTVEVVDTNNLLEIETSTAVTHGDGISIVELETTTADVIEITTGVFTSSGSGGSSNASEIVGLTSFINNVIDNATIDCGTP